MKQYLLYENQEKIHASIAHSSMIRKQLSVLRKTHESFSFNTKEKRITDNLEKATL